MEANALRKHVVRVKSSKTAPHSNHTEEHTSIFQVPEIYSSHAAS
jgi:hypothetical protein